jgi:hypothetical protein
MSNYYCHSCAAISGWMSAASPTSLTGTTYQLEKFIKHTVPTGSYPFVSVFDDPNYGAYRNYVVYTSGSGCLEIDDRGRRNLIWVAGMRVGATFENGVLKSPDDAVKVVLYDDEWKIHAYPTLSDHVETKRCVMCGQLVVY